MNNSNSNKNMDKFWFQIDDLLCFLFPQNLQHPLAASRLFIFGLYGPLDTEGRLRSGIGGNHVVSEYELEAMCEQTEREDLVQIYLHNPRQMGLLSTAEQDALINQADAKLKREKGKAMLPKLTRQDVIEILEPISRDEMGRLNFHETQILLETYRKKRIKDYKLVFPNLTNKSATKNTLQNSTKLILNSSSLLQDITNCEQSIRSSRQKTVSLAVAPETMFQKMKGLTNADLIDQTTKMLSKHAFKMSDIDGKQSTEITGNVKLLRDIPPKYDNPYEGTRSKWDSISAFKGSSIGSGVKTTGSSSTWKQKYTSY